MVHLRQVVASDCDELYALVTRNVDRLVDYFPVTVREVASVDTAKISIINYTDNWNKNVFRVYVIEYDGDIVGLQYLKHIDTRHSKCELAYFVDKDHMGKGIVAEAIKQAIRIAFYELELNKVFAKIDVDNTASRRVSEKAGLKLEGVLRQDYRTGEGRLVDVAYYGILKSDL
ncbi:MAG: GNAT family N-acetyltransferase [Chitinophagales bacterium]|nr:GNAT family N-acetyltransferase [Chitinophagales bacterium]